MVQPKSIYIYNNIKAPSVTANTQQISTPHTRFGEFVFALPNQHFLLTQGRVLRPCNLITQNPHNICATHWSSGRCPNNPKETARNRHTFGHIIDTHDVRTFNVSPHRMCKQ